MGKQYRAKDSIIWRALGRHSQRRRYVIDVCLASTKSGAIKEFNKSIPTGSRARADWLKTGKTIEMIVVG